MTHDGPLSWLVPQLAAIEDWSAVLADRSRRDEHLDAALSVLDALHRGAAAFLPMVRSLPLPAGRPDDGMELRLRLLGETVDEALRRNGLSWPPPFDVPPPAVTRDLLWFLRLADERPASHLLFHQRVEVGLQTIVTRTANLRDDVALGLADVVTAPVAGGAGRSRVSGLLTGLTLLITLLQGPGAVLDFPADAAELGRAVAVVGGGVAEITGETFEAVERWYDRWDDADTL
ncbi:hypothetical protein [Spirilliplanes yamanashiensis]|uniref:Uncharacterized protein n=1 Tax=Spirilliplanes yamanashiensis TaxID=42233 RepID=A0A8J3YA64_9ACTN|nr:hypothetical protein [Spirilliplanes yamanashiensis]MDP9816020.1 hypothetical protein [Spirilliplanes yamanashiensis]GIJ04280.1 hypothetical protein Sya03_36320 [Spirilliplanes yamanashiensis]